MDWEQKPWLREEQEQKDWKDAIEPVLVLLFVVILLAAMWGYGG